MCAVQTLESSQMDVLFFISFLLQWKNKRGFILMIHHHSIRKHVFKLCTTFLKICFAIN